MSRTAPTAFGAERPRRSAKRVVVKVGSSSLTTADGGIDDARLRRSVDALAGAAARGLEIVLVSSGAIAAGLAPLGLRSAPARPRPPAGGRQRRAGPAHAPLHRRLRPTRHPGRPGAADRRRRDPARPLPQRLPDLRQAARARRAARSSTRTTPSRPPRSGSATTTGWPPSSPTSSTPTRSCCCPTSTASTTATPRTRRRAARSRWSAAPHDLARRRRSAAAARSAPAAWRPSSRPRGSRPVRASRPSSARADQVGDGAGWRDVGTWFAPTGKRRSTRLLWLAHATEPKGAAGARRGRRARRRRPAGRRCCRPGSSACAGRSSPASRSTWSTRTAVVIARGLVNYDADEIPAPARSVDA